MVVCDICGKQIPDMLSKKIRDGYICNQCHSKFQEICGQHDCCSVKKGIYLDLLSHPANSEKMMKHPGTTVSSVCYVCGKSGTKYITQDQRGLCNDCGEDCLTISDESKTDLITFIKSHDSRYLRKMLSECYHPKFNITFNFITKKIYLKDAIRKKNYKIISFDDIVGFNIVPLQYERSISFDYRYEGKTFRYICVPISGPKEDYGHTKVLDCCSRIPGFTNAASVRALQNTGTYDNPSNLLRCPRCGGSNCTAIVETNTSGKDFSVGKGCCGFTLLGPIGILCGACGKGKQTTSTTYWMCSSCGNKFRK